MMALIFYRVIEWFCLPKLAILPSKKLTVHTAHWAPSLVVKRRLLQIFTVCTVPLIFYSAANWLLHGIYAGRDRQVKDEWLLHCLATSLWHVSTEINFCPPSDFYIVIVKPPSSFRSHMTSFGPCDNGYAQPYKQLQTS